MKAVRLKLSAMLIAGGVAAILLAVSIVANDYGDPE